VFIASCLDQHIKNKAVLIDGAPKSMLLAVDRNHDLVKMPLVAKPRRTPADFVSDVASEFLGPAPNRFMTDNDAARGQKIFDHPQAERKAEIQPDTVVNHFSGKAMAPIEGLGRLIIDVDYTKIVPNSST
jgi:hypothetical protein